MQHLNGALTSRFMPWGLLICCPGWQSIITVLRCLRATLVLAGHGFLTKILFGVLAGGNARHAVPHLPPSKLGCDTQQEGVFAWLLPLCPSLSLRFMYFIHNHLYPVHAVILGPVKLL